MKVLSNEELRKYREEINGEMVYTKRSLVKIFDIVGSTDQAKLRKASDILSDLKNSHFYEWQGTENPVKLVTNENSPKRNKITVIDSDYFELYYDKEIRNYKKGISIKGVNSSDGNEIVIDMRKPIIIRDTTAEEEKEGIRFSIDAPMTKNLDKIAYTDHGHDVDADLVKEVRKKFGCDSKPAKMLITYSKEIQRLKEVLYWVKHPDEYNEFMHEGFPDAPSDKVFNIKDEITDDMLPEEYEIDYNGYKILRQFGWHSDLLLDQ